MPAKQSKEFASYLLASRTSPSDTEDGLRPLFPLKLPSDDPWDNSVLLKVLHLVPREQLISS